jgi:hypothetical protein
MKNTFIAISSAGHRDHFKICRAASGMSAAFIDQLVAEGFILMGGPWSMKAARSNLQRQRRK